MTIPFRTSTAAGYRNVLAGLRLNTSRLLNAQNQLSTGLRIQKPSDDPIGSARVLGLEERLAASQRRREALLSGVDVLDAGASQLEGASSLLSEVRALLIQGMNGTLNEGDREVIAQQMELLGEQLLDVANSEFNGAQLFGGTGTGAAPFEVREINGQQRVVYVGDENELMLDVGADSLASVGLPGSEIFAVFEPSGITLTGTTGAALGATANEGSGWEQLRIRHDSTDLGGLTAFGIASASGGDLDSHVGSQALVIDTANGTMQLGDGPPVALPAPGDDASSVVVTNAQGGELYLDLSAWDGSAVTGNVVGEASVSFGENSFEPLDMTDADVLLTSDANGNVMHLDATEIGASGIELVQYSGAVNVFDLVQGIANDLRNEDGIYIDSVFDRLGSRLDELDRHIDNVSESLGKLGARSQRLTQSEQRFASASLQLEGLRSDLQDADIAAVVIDLQRSNQALQLSQAAGSTLLQTSLLDFIR